jgi:hypothetical protein
VIKKTIIFAALSLLIVGCAPQVAKLTQTQSGSPEVVVAEKDIDKIKQLMIAEHLNHGYEISSDTKYNISFKRAAKGGEDYIAYFSVGNAYSTNYRENSYTFVGVPDGTKIIGTPYIIAHMPMGQVNKSTMNGNAKMYNIIQEWLFDLRDKLKN